MKNTENKYFTEDKLFQSIGKSEVLIEQHDEALEEIEEEKENIEGWFTVILKAIKTAILN